MDKIDKQVVEIIREGSSPLYDDMSNFDLYMLYKDSLEYASLRLSIAGKQLGGAMTDNVYQDIQSAIYKIKEVLKWGK